MKVSLLHYAKCSVCIKWIKVGSSSDESGVLRWITSRVNPGSYRGYSVWLREHGVVVYYLLKVIKTSMGMTRKEKTFSLSSWRKSKSIQKRLLSGCVLSQPQPTVPLRILPCPSCKAMKEFALPFSGQRKWAWSVMAWLQLWQMPRKNCACVLSQESFVTNSRWTTTSALLLRCGLLIANSYAECKKLPEIPKRR